jgi:hypothetical protein
LRAPHCFFARRCYKQAPHEAGARTRGRSLSSQTGQSPPQTNTRQAQDRTGPDRKGRQAQATKEETGQSKGSPASKQADKQASKQATTRVSQNERVNRTATTQNTAKAQRANTHNLRSTTRPASGPVGPHPPNPKGTSPPNATKHTRPSPQDHRERQLGGKPAALGRRRTQKSSTPQRGVPGCTGSRRLPG